MSGYWNIYIPDLHLGSVYASIIDFLYLISRARNLDSKINEVIFVGDFLDGMDKYETQSYKQPPETLRIQREGLKWLIELINNELRPSKIIFVLGNHEEDFKGGFIDVELMEKVYTNVKFVRRYIDSLGMLCIHQLGRTNRFGSQSGWTPSTVAKAKELILNAVRNGKNGIRGLVTAHVHKVLDILVTNTDILILLPSFLKSEKECADNIMYNPAIVAFDGDQISILQKPFESTELVRDFNMFLFNMLLIDRRMIDTISKIFELWRSSRKDSETKEEGSSEPNSLESSKNESGEDRIIVSYGGKVYRITRSLAEKILELYRIYQSKTRVAKELNVCRDIVYATLKYFTEKY